jgi:hypothetical protein
MAIVAALFAGFFGRLLGPRKGAVAAVLGIGLYTVLVGANPPEWVENLSPEILLLSVSGKDGRGMPSKETLLAVEGYTLLRTDRNGWIELTTAGEAAIQAHHTPLGPTGTNVDLTWP